MEVPLKPAEPIPEIDEEVKEVLFKANAGPQSDFLAASEQEVLYGGAAGGGKSYAMVVDPVRYFGNPLYKGLLVRRTTEELRELISVSKQLYPRYNPQARWSEREKTWFFPSGASLWMSYLEKDDDVMRYQGQAFSWIGFDELTQWPSPYAWNYMRSRLRTTTASNLPTFMRGTSNPGGPGHVWVKKTFVDPAVPNKPFWAMDLDGEIMVWPKNSRYAQANGLVDKPMFKRRFIPANLFDNPYLSEDGSYEANLLSMPEHLRRQLLEGDWDVAEGAAFSEFNRRIHVVEPFMIPHDWVRFRACDYGYGSATFVLWLAVDPNSDQLIVYREHKCSKVTAVDLAETILEMEYGERIRYGVLDSSLWHTRGDPGPSLAEQMINRGCRWRPSDRSRGSRVASKNEVHRRLQVDPFTEKPRLVIFSNCLNLITELPALPLDKKNPEDVDTKSEDHGYDALRYAVQSRPWNNWMEGSGSTFHHHEPADPTFGY